jgi:hypothetical protein
VDGCKPLHAGSTRHDSDDAEGAALHAALSDASFGVRVRVYVYTADEIPEVAQLAPSRGCKAEREVGPDLALIARHIIGCQLSQQNKGSKCE